LTTGKSTISLVRLSWRSPVVWLGNVPLTRSSWTVTDGIRYWLTTMRTPLSCAQPSQELLVRGTFPSHTTGNLQLNLTKDMVDLPVVKTLFFVQKSSQKTIHPQYLHQVPEIALECLNT
jgi:hypothetical protein